MLHYFPSPYPDELWYSVLCRYHVRSGNPTNLTTIKALFPGKTDVVMGSLFPNNILYEIISQLPEGFLDIENIALEHTLFKYAFRFQPLEKKKDMLKQIREGKSAFPMKICEAEQKYPKLKMCPLCRKEDMERYGESYWHLGHQIPLVHLCSKHRCALQFYECSSRSELKRKFLLPDQCKNDIKTYEVKSYDDFLTDTLTKYQYLPLEIGPTNGYNNIYEDLINKGYGTVRRDKGFLMNLKKISRDMCSLFGEDFIAKNFVRKDIDRFVSNQMRTWNVKTPERYAMLATLVKQPPEITFSKKRVENHLYAEFIKISQEPVRQSREHIAKRLDIKPDNVSAIAYNLKIQPFWKEPQSETSLRERFILSLSHEQKVRLMAFKKEHGFANASSLILYCVERTLSEMEGKRNEI